MSPNLFQMRMSSLSLCTKTGIKHTLTLPYHPRSNGASERAVRKVEKAFVKHLLGGNNGRSIQHRQGNFLFKYRTTPHSTTAAVPTELMMKHRLRTPLNQVKPDLAQTIESKQNKQKNYKDLKGHQDRVFVGNDIILARNTESSSNTENMDSGFVDLELIELRPVIIQDMFMLIT